MRSEDQKAQDLLQSIEKQIMTKMAKAVGVAQSQIKSMIARNDELKAYYLNLREQVLSECLAR